ncbi:MAG TPA: CPBP family intramembrane glutamic endopeptidase [Ktedonobacteraceae bacterium]|jgi:membrane protease YdiL (CAAX protease family)
MAKLERPTLQTSVEEVPWTLQQTFLVILITFILRIIFSLALSGGSNPQTIPTLSPSMDAANALVTFILTILLQSIFLIGPLYFASRPFRESTHRAKETLRVLGFRRFAVWPSLAWVVGLFIGILLINYIYQSLITIFHLNLVTNDQTYYEMSKHAPITVYTVLFISIFIAPVCEEIFFRSFMFMGLVKGMPREIAIVLSALIFAVAHGDVGSFIVLFFIGLALAFLRWRTQSIWPGILLHLLNNTLASLTIILPMLGLMSR